MDDEPLDLHALADQLLEKAATGDAGRAGRTLPHPVDGLRQTLIALSRGAELHEHESPGPASLVVLRGRVRLVAGARTTELSANWFSAIPNERHGLVADEDSVVLLSVSVPQRAPAG